ncbi:AEC family transporter [Staphylococcus durrellii]|uniref:AEC family transporter n=1 Tax=Staphylococcus durrellii TaxID=2781773 RepID=UPI00189F6EE6|nr:AEC family transporter [Staphylococcus durrellii]MBF7018106.1 AEC family transporter [Staphylococcus durrellii]
MITTVIDQCLILLLFLIVGFVCTRKIWIHKNHMSSLSNLLTNIVLPSAILSSFNVNVADYDLNFFVTIIFISLFLVAFPFFLSKLLVSFTHMEIALKKVWVGCCTYSNILFIGIPIIGTLYGEKGLFILVIYNTISNLFLFTLGIKLYKNNVNFKSIGLSLLSPALLASFLGILLLILDISLPKTLATALKELGNMTAPLSMIITGALFGLINIKKFIVSKNIYLFCFVRLIVIPGLVFVILNSFITDKLILGVIVLSAGMPAGATNTSLATIYSDKGPETSQYVVMSSILCIITLPILMYILTL